MPKTIKEILEEAYSNAYEAIYKTLKDNNVKYDDNSDTIFVDDDVNKETYFLDVVLNKCAEYGGEN